MINSTDFICEGVLSEAAAAELARQIEARQASATRLMDLDCPAIPSLVIQRRLDDAQYDSGDLGLREVILERTATELQQYGFAPGPARAIATAIGRGKHD